MGKWGSYLFFLLNLTYNWRGWDIFWTPYFFFKGKLCWWEYNKVSHLLSYVPNNVAGVFLDQFSYSYFSSQMRKWWLRAMKKLAQGHACSEGPTQDWKPGFSFLRFLFRGEGLGICSERTLCRWEAEEPLTRCVHCLPHSLCGFNSSSRASVPDDLFTSGPCFYFHFSSVYPSHRPLLRSISVRMWLPKWKETSTLFLSLNFWLMAPIVFGFHSCSLFLHGCSPCVSRGNRESRDP